ncbi:hypothetical protein ACFOMD_03870 [Sphingoaurantiacus capsulatus]|uniref:Hydrolase n=1 Tax=Sphingoaurantiacus capsulatus TaxID=1771310 RepID=A0ABV7X7H0_9SPHN
MSVAYPPADPDAVDHDHFRRTAPVALDIDAVLCDLVGGCRLACAEFLGVAPEVLFLGENYYVPWEHPDPALTARLAPVMVEMWTKEQTILSAKPVEGGLALATTIANAGRLKSYITRRPPEVDFLTERWLRTHGFPLDGVELHHVGGTNACKSVTARAVGATLLIDDSVNETTSALGNGMHVVMVAMNYNRAAAVELAAKYGDRFFDAADTTAALAAVMPEDAR